VSIPDELTAVMVRESRYKRCSESSPETTLPVAKENKAPIDL